MSDITGWSLTARSVGGVLPGCVLIVVLRRCDSCCTPTGRVLANGHGQNNGLIIRRSPVRARLGALVAPIGSARPGGGFWRIEAEGPPGRNAPSKLDSLSDCHFVSDRVAAGLPRVVGRFL